MTYLSPKVWDVQAEHKEVVNNNISKNLQNLNTIVKDTGQAIDHMALNSLFFY